MSAPTAWNRIPTGGQPASHESVQPARAVGGSIFHQRFHGSLTSALTALQDIWLRDSSCESFKDVLAELKSFRAELVGLFTIEVREPDRDRHRKVSA